MSSFTDESDRKWVLRVDVAAIKSVRDALKFNLGDLGETADNFLRLADDPCLLCDVLYLLCEDQAKERNISDTDFGRLLAGDVIFNATVALEEAITDFFPQAKRSLLQRLRKKTDRVQTMGINLVSEKLDDPELERQIQVRMKAKMEAMIQGSLAPSNSVTNSPESPG